MTARTNPLPRRRGFSITELLVVFGILAVLVGLLFPVLAGFVKSGKMTKSMSNMRQIATWMRMYSADNRDFIVPSQFNYSPSEYPNLPSRGKVRSAVNIGLPNQGTWTDILWTINDVGFFRQAEAATGIDYRFDSPDAKLYEIMAGEIDNPFRSAVTNTKGTPGSTANWLPKPFGCGTNAIGQPGFFAANNFFNADPAAVNCDQQQPIPDNWYTTVQIRVPERSMYLVDSFAGEVIEADLPSYQVVPPPLNPTAAPTVEVDFRYNEVCLMLFLDGHLETVGKWDDLNQLEGPGGPGIRVRDLHKRKGLGPGGPP